MLKNLRRFLRLLSPYRGRVNVAILVGAVSGIGTGAGFAKGAEFLFGKIFSGERDMTLEQLLVVAMVFPALFLAVGVSNFVSAYLLNQAGLATLRDLRARVFAHLQDLPIAYFQTRKTGDLISRVTTDVQMLQHTLAMVARDLFIQPLTLVSAIGYLTYTALQHEGVVYIYVCIAILPLVVFPIRFFSRKIEKKARSQQEEIAGLTNNLAQNLGAAREVRAFNLQAKENASFRERVEELFRAQMKVVKYSFSLSPIIELISSLGLSVAFVLGYRNGVDGGVFLGIFLALYFSYSPLKRIGTFSGELHKGSAALARIQEILDTQATIADPADPIELPALRGEIAFRDVSFNYGENPALRGVSATIDPGEVCALVGPSGAGKSTFANLVPRFYDASAGAVLIDGHDVRRFRQNDLRSRIAIVSQEPVLFDDTILENIRLGRQDATNAEVEEAARQAFADDFIRELPKGYQTLVGERGARLSGGQKQRIAIARAFLRRAPILILDEATSALDSESEKMVQQALATLVRGKTVLIIAHRFSTIRDASKILVFEDGRIIDAGPHADLYARCDLYRKLYDQQRGA